MKICHTFRKEIEDFFLFYHTLALSLSHSFSVCLMTTRNWSTDDIDTNDNLFWIYLFVCVCVGYGVYLQFYTKYIIHLYAQWKHLFFSNFTQPVPYSKIVDRES